MAGANLASFLVHRNQRIKGGLMVWDRVAYRCARFESAHRRREQNYLQLRSPQISEWRSRGEQRRQFEVCSERKGTNCFSMVSSSPRIREFEPVVPKPLAHRRRRPVIAYRATTTSPTLASRSRNTCPLLCTNLRVIDRKSTRLNSSHAQ